MLREPQPAYNPSAWYGHLPPPLTPPPPTHTQTKTNLNQAVLKLKAYVEWEVRTGNQGDISTYLWLPVTRAVTCSVPNLGVIM
jgi:hypothetical protein